MIIKDLLSKSEPWLQYAIRWNILHEQKGSLLELKMELLKEPRIQSYLYAVSHFHDQVVSSHKNMDLPMNKLFFLLDMGLDRSIPEINTAIQEILSHQDEHGVYLSRTNVPVRFGGSGQDTFAWSLCDAPLLLLNLILAGLDYATYCQPGVDYLASLCRDNGFPCSVSRELGSFRGPGKKSDPCPHATILMLRLMSEIEEYRSSDLADIALESILLLWEHSRELHPYMFYMGTDFRKLKAPPIWYDILSVCDCLSRYPRARRDPRFMEMVHIIQAKETREGFLIPESIYQKAKGMDFGQKKQPSMYLSYLWLRIQTRL